MAGPVGMSGSSAGGGEGGAAAAGGGARREAEPLDTPPPPYPPSARRRGLEGRVVLDLTIDAGGRTVAVALVRSSGVGSLDDAAREAVAGWRFRPAHRDGQPVESRRQVPIRFQLNGLALAHGD
jgi:protein TonB